MKPYLLGVAISVVVLLNRNSLLAQSEAQQAGYRYLSPVPDAPYVSAQTRFILVRFAEVIPTQVTNLASDFISVVGNVSGPHSGFSRAASDGQTVMFQISADFHSNELVTVSLNPKLSAKVTGNVKPYNYQFMVTAPMPGHFEAALRPYPTFPSTSRPSEERRKSAEPTSGSQPRGGKALANAIIASNGVSLPGDFPQVVITVNSNPSPGYLFLENGLDGVPPYTMMLDNNGLPIWYRRGRMYDFKIQKNGLISWCLQDGAGFPAMDTNFNYVRTYLTTNGYYTDGHDLKVLSNGRYLMIGYRNNSVDLSRYFSDGSTNGYVRETVVQEFTAMGELIFQWRAWDNYDIRLTGSDFPHINGVDIDEDGNILVSARYLSEVTKVNRDTGEIMWRLGGDNTDFDFVNDSFDGPSWQHNITALGHNHYLLFDNGDNHAPQVSRAVEYELDLTNLIATLVWEFRDTPDKYAYWLGSAQRLPSGNTLINFVLPQYPKAIEVDPDGVKHFELSLVPGADAYRAFRFPWNGVATAPYLLLEPQADNLTLIFNKFGDTNVVFYRIYADTVPAPTTVFATSTNTLKAITSLTNGLRYYFRVTAMSRDGIESDFSNEQAVTANIVKPGQQMILNGDFSQGQDAWNWVVAGVASAQWQINNGVSFFAITAGGTTATSLQFWQPGKPLVQGKNYVFEFDAWSTAPRYIQASVGQYDPPNLTYSGTLFSHLTPTLTHFRYVFTMQSESDFDASVIFNLGASMSSVYLANVSLVMLAPGDFNLDGSVNLNDLSVFTSYWMQQGAGVPADLNGDGKVDFADFGIFGDNWSGGSQ